MTKKNDKIGFSLKRVAKATKKTVSKPLKKVVSKKGRLK